MRARSLDSPGKIKYLGTFVIAYSEMRCDFSRPARALPRSELDGKLGVTVWISGCYGFWQM